MHDTVAELSARNRYDACLVLGDLCMAGYAADVQARTQILDMCDDVAMSYERRAHIVNNAIARAYYRWQAKIIRSNLRRTSPAFSRILAISELDAASISREVDVPVVTVPNCVDTELFRPELFGVRVPHNPSILFVGAMRAWSNRDAVEWFTSSVMPLILRENRTAQLQLVGPGTEELAIDSPSVVALGFAKNLAAEYRKCDVFVCPLRVGTGIKNKLMEALASGCAIVSTDVGIEGLAVRHREHLLVANDPVQFAEAVNRLLIEPELRTRLGKAARAFAEETFSKATISGYLRTAILLPSM
jgi:glycosyltransferase involved in cell wall biosynthesis